MTWTVNPFNDSQLWNKVIEESQFPFLLHRNFIAYHGENKFKDSSLTLAYKNKTKGIFVAHEINDIIYSHQGLTFGGLWLENSKDSYNWLCAFQAILSFYKDHDYKTINIKTPPAYLSENVFNHHQLFTQILKADYSFNAEYIIPLSTDIAYSTRRIRQISKAENCNIQIQESNMYDAFWSEILEPLLASKYKTKPIHTLNDINYLIEKFPDSIQLITAKLESKLVAGIVLFKFKESIRAQYIASSDFGKAVGALDLIMKEIISNYSNTGYLYFSLGSSMISNSNIINKNLAKWKHEFGAILQLTHNFETNISEGLEKLNNYIEAMDTYH